MKLSKKTIKKLLSTIEKEENFFLSVYLPITPEVMNRPLSKELGRRLSSLSREALKKHHLLKKQDKLRDELTQKIERKVSREESFKKGISLFAVLPTKGEQKVKLFLFHLPYSSEKEVNIATSFDVDQLIWMQNRVENAVVLEIKRSEAKIYSLQEGDFSLLLRKKNEYRSAKVKEKKEGLKRAKLGKGKKAYYGTGENKIQKGKEKENRLFLNDLKESLRSTSSLNKKSEYLIVFYSEPFQEIIKPFVGKNSLKSHFEPMLVKKSFQNEEELKRAALEIIDEHQTKITKSLMEEYKRTPEKFKKGWEEVLKAARLKKIKTLFIHPKAEKKGCVDESFLPYTSQNKCRVVENIAPWLVKIVFESGGEVRVVKENEVQAGLRF